MTTHIKELEYNGMKLFVSRTGAKDVVAIEGSVLGGSNMLPRTKSEVASMTAELLDAGTAKRSKESIREALGARGASISFSAGGDRTYFSASCLPEDISFVLKIIVECLTEAYFPTKELLTAKKRALGELDEAKSQTRTVAAGALSRLLYDPSHVNYAETFSARKKSIETLSRNDLLAFRKMLGMSGLILVITGDIQVDTTLKNSKAILAKLPKGISEVPEKKLNKKKPAVSQELVSITDKANIDVYVGVSVPMTYQSKEYLPFVVLSEMLGGRGFTSHLMSTIRERDGLTYGVYTMLSGFGGGADGSFQIWATFSPDKYTESVSALKKEIALFFKKLLTQKSLEARKTEMAGAYIVGLSTTRGLANVLHKIGVEGKPLSYIDEYPELIKAITVDDLHKAAALIPLSRLSLAAAGTFKK